MSLEQLTLNYVHYCDSLMLTNALNLALYLAIWLQFLKIHINQIMQIPLFDPLTHMTWKKGDPYTDLDMHINLAQFQPRF